MPTLPCFSLFNISRAVWGLERFCLYLNKCINISNAFPDRKLFPFSHDLSQQNHGGLPVIHQKQY